MSKVGASAIEWTCPLKLQKTWLSGYLPLVRLRNLNVITFLATGMLDVSQKIPFCVGPGVGVTIGVADGAVHSDIPPGAGDGESLDAARAGCRGIDRGPGRGVGRGLDLERLAGGGLPVEDHPADRLGRTKVDLDPLGIAEGARPAGAGVAVEGGPG